MARMGSQRQELMKIICEVLRCPFYIRGTPKHTEVKVDSVAYQGGGGNGPTLGTGNKEVHYLYRNNQTHEELFCSALPISGSNMSVIKHSSPLAQTLPTAPSPHAITKAGKGWKKV